VHIHNEMHQQTYAIHYDNGRLHGVVMESIGNATLRLEHYKHGYLHGTAKYWDANGNPQHECQYAHGKIVGCEKIWDFMTHTLKNIYYHDDAGRRHGKMESIRNGYRDVMFYYHGLVCASEKEYLELTMDE
jgi:antitoxin component YwqK of YwqJK toxin-antitoxin module